MPGHAVVISAPGDVGERFASVLHAPHTVHRAAMDTDLGYSEPGFWDSNAGTQNSPVVLI